MDIFGGIKFSPKQLVTFVLCEYFAKLIFTKTVKIATSSMFSLTHGKHMQPIKLVGDGKLDENVLLADITCTYFKMCISP